jgi:hypothetical protein
MRDDAFHRFMPQECASYYAAGMSQRNQDLL